MSIGRREPRVALRRMGMAIPAVRTRHRISSTADARRKIMKPRRLDAMLHRRRLPAKARSGLTSWRDRLGDNPLRRTKRIDRIAELVDRHRAARRTSRGGRTAVRMRDQIADHRRLRNAAPAETPSPPTRADRERA